MLARSLSTTNDSSSASSSSFSVDDLYDVPLADVRNFCVLAHVDHGKSSLAARMLECAGNRAPLSDRDGVDALDTLSVERERGITVKATAASMAVHHPRATGPTGRMLLNMVDTPGHADFGSEVTRSLAASQGGVLLFDASQGVQAQTFSVHDKARRMGVRLIPALTKVDLPTADPVEVALSGSDLFGFDPDAVLLTSARANVGVREVLDAVCDLVPPPAPLRGDDDDDGVLRARVVDSWFEPLHGVVCLVQIASGTLSEGDRVVAVAPGAADDASDLVARPARDVGVLVPDRVRTGTLRRGQMGYAVVGVRDPRAARPGSVLVRGRDAASDARTFFAAADVAVDDAAPSSSALYASVHPTEGETIDALRDAVDRLALNDAGLEVRATSGASSSSSSGGGPFLGPGLRVGFQGPLHAEVFRQRLRDEFDVDAVVTPPKVPYRVTLYGRRGARAAETTTSIVEDLSEWPLPDERYEVEEPVVRLRVLAPSRHAGDVTELVHRRRGRDVESGPLGADDHGVSSTSSSSSSSFVNDWILTARVPWAEVVTDLHEELKNRTSGHASFDYDDDDATTDFQPADLVKVDVTLNDETVGPLSFVAHRDEARARGRVVCSRLKEVLPRRQFVTVIRAVADGNRILASERVRAYRKDVLVKSGKNVGGGDVTRKKKLLEKQKKGKKRQQETGRVTLSQAAFNSVVGRSS